MDITAFFFNVRLLLRILPDHILQWSYLAYLVMVLRLLLCIFLKWCMLGSSAHLKAKILKQTLGPHCIMKRKEMTWKGLHRL